jgi:hypothetical protein
LGSRLGSNGVKNKTIHKVIRALMENQFTKIDYPFLLNYQILDQFKGEDFKIELLKEIAFATHYLIGTQNDEFLQYWVTNQFLSMVNLACGGVAMPLDLLKLTLLQNKDIKGYNFVNWLAEYNQSMLKFLLQYVEGEHDYIKKLIEFNRQSDKLKRN